jgi:hypothetical protein
LAADVRGEEFHQWQSGRFMPYAKWISQFLVGVLFPVGVSFSLSGCWRSKIKVTVASGNNSAATVKKISPLAAYPNTRIRLAGENLSQKANLFVRLPLLNGGFFDSILRDATSSTAYFNVPEGMGIGLKTARLMRGDEVLSSFSMVADQNTNTLPIIIDDQSEVCSTKQYIDRNGDVKTGTKSCDGSSGQPNAWDIRSGVVINGVTGKLPVSCRNGIDLTRSDIVMPSIPVNAPAVTSGDWTITDSSVVTIGSRLQLIAETTAPGGFTNGAFYFVTSTSGSTFTVSSTNGGATISVSSGGAGSMVFLVADNSVAEAWDTIDDDFGFSAVIPTSYSGWSTENNCGGIEAAPGDQNIWSDVTTTDGVTASTCALTPLNCSLKDKVSGQEWSNKMAGATTWPAAISYCDNLTYNGKTDWRLPTQKEMMTAYAHGMASTITASNWLSLVDTQNYFWSATTVSDNRYYAWSSSFGFGGIFPNVKNHAYRVMCVRP